MFIIFYLLAAIFLFAKLKQKKIQLSLRIFSALTLGLLLGVILKFSATTNLTFYITEFLRLLGSGYLLLLKMLVMPLIITSILNSMLNVGSHNLQQIKQISITASATLLILTIVASFIGIGVALFFHIGEGLTLPAVIFNPSHTPSSFIDTLLAMIPSNPFASLAKENTISVVIFTLFVGIAARTLKQSEAVKLVFFNQFIAAAFIIIKNLTRIILNLTPYGVFGLMALLIVTQGFAILLAMLNFIFAAYVAILMMFAVHSIVLLFFGYSPLAYFKNAMLALFVAFTTRSSFGTLPVTEEVLREKFKTQNVVSSFVPSIGATIGMNGCAGIYPAMLVVMTLAMMQQPLTWQLTLMIALINAIASLGISGIPGTAYIAATVTLTSLNLPYAIVALVQGVDPIVDMGRTALNVNGTLTASLVTNRLLTAEDLAQTSAQQTINETS